VLDVATDWPGPLPRKPSSLLLHMKAVDPKVAAEQAFYLAQREAIQHRLLGYSGVGRGTPEARTESEKTIYYGRIRISADRDARLVADGIVASEWPQVLAAVIDYLDRGVREEGKLRLTLIQRDRDLTSKLLDQLETIDEQKAQLATVRERLVILSQRPSSLQELELYLNLGKGVITTLNNPK
jgi:hypothetical protein